MPRSIMLAWGLATMLQLVPFQCCINGFALPLLPSFCRPTAHTSLLAAAATLAKRLPFTKGVDTTLRFDQLKCSASVTTLLAVLPIEPTAQMSLSAIARVPLRLELLMKRLETTCTPCCPKARPGPLAIIPIASSLNNKRVRGAFALQQLT